MSNSSSRKSSTKTSRKTAEDYSKLSQREHVLLRPDTYIGSIENDTDVMDIYNQDNNQIISQEIDYVPGFYKIYDEVLVNARDASINDDTCDTIKINYNKEEGYISVWNNGQGIPVEMNEKEKLYIPTMIFGHLLTSSNYDDTQKRTTGGKNGIGGKVANIYSSRYIVDIGDPHNQKRFIQTWEDNMANEGKAKITKYSKKSGYVHITFYPDVEKFGISDLDNNHYELFYRRAIDLAGTTPKVKVYFNDKKIDCNNFKKYINFYFNEEDGTPTVYYEEIDRWQVGAVFYPESNNKTVSFVNGINTYRGGTHVNNVVDKIVKSLSEVIKKKNKDIKISPVMIKDNMIFFINSIIENPKFDSQTKHTLGSKVSTFGSSYTPSDTFIKKLTKCGIVDLVISTAKFKEKTLLKKSDGKQQKRITNIPKLDDANKAGTKESNKCTLFLTEGDSAAAYGRGGGLSVLGRDYFGVFPLKGKLLNVREASVQQITKNDEINNLKQIIGLRQGCLYEDDEEFNTLRYGRIVCLTDADVDGSHIKGLLMNFFHNTWPELLKRPGFFTSLATPIVKATKGKDVKTFYTLTDYENFMETNPKGYKIKYYKGLGTSTTAEAKECFKDFEEKVINYDFENEKETIGAITLAFEKKKANDRKEWLMKYNRNIVLDYDNHNVSCNDFIHKDLIHFSNDDLNRSIPHIMDGFKPSQRKIFFGAVLRGLDKKDAEVKVAQLAGFVSDRAAYHHGEASLTGAIVNMAQTFIGSNNINILEPLGQFGTRNLGGKDAASPRYIFTSLSERIMTIFNKNDNNVLSFEEDDGQIVEPTFYAPIIPMALVNGAVGIGTGFSTNIPNFNPKDIIQNIYNLMDDKSVKSMKPYYNNFKGIYNKIDKQNYETVGLYMIKKNKLIIEELPIGMWTQSYKEFLNKMMEKTKEFTGYIEKHKDENIYFELKFTGDYLEKNNEKIPTLFKLTSKISLTNMHLFSTSGAIKKYNNVKDILKEYYTERLNIYSKRKEYQLNQLQKELDLLTWKCKFILMVVNKELKVNNKKKADIEEDLIKHKFPKIENSYNYLLSMPIYNLTKEKIEELKKQRDEKEAEYKYLESLTEKDIWRSELNTLEKMCNF